MVPGFRSRFQVQDSGLQVPGSSFQVPCSSFRAACSCKQFCLSVLEDRVSLRVACQFAMARTLASSKASGVRCPARLHKGVRGKAQKGKKAFPTAVRLRKLTTKKTKPGKAKERASTKHMKGSRVGLGNVSGRSTGVQWSGHKKVVGQVYCCKFVDEYTFQVIGKYVRRQGAKA